MKQSLLIIAFLTLLVNCFCQITIKNYKEEPVKGWLSISANGASYGFYGQEFTFSKDVLIQSVSVYIVDNARYDESQASLNYSIWSFDREPKNEIFLSDPLNIDKGDRNN